MIIDGKKIAKNLEEKLATELLFSVQKKVCFVVFEENAATTQFVALKTCVAERVGIIVDTKKYSNIITTDEAIKLVRNIGKQDYDGIVVQLPLAPTIDTQAVLDEIPPLKDIDMLGISAKESYVKGKIDRMPPVARAVYEILDTYGIDLENKKIVIVGNGRLVGEPVHLMFKRMKVPHDIIDRNTPATGKKMLIKNADIIISGTGVPYRIKPDMIKKGAVLIDAGTSEQAGKLVGDIDPSCAEKASYFTPVPGGLGPITIVSLLRNLV